MALSITTPGMVANRTSMKRPRLRHCSSKACTMLWTRSLKKNRTIAYHSTISFTILRSCHMPVQPWAFCERLSSAGTDKIIWKEIRRQLESRDIVNRKGVVQNASFITYDHRKHGRKKPPVDPAQLAPQVLDGNGENPAPADRKEGKRQANAEKE